MLFLEQRLRGKIDSNYNIFESAKSCKFCGCVCYVNGVGAWVRGWRGSKIWCSSKIDLVQISTWFIHLNSTLSPEQFKKNFFRLPLIAKNCAGEKADLNKTAYQP